MKTNNTKRTPEELAAFKAANIARCNATRKTIIIEPRKADRRFTITWTTPAGRFGWTTVQANTKEEAAEAWFTDRGRRRIPADAEIAVIKKGGQEV